MFAIVPAREFYCGLGAIALTNQRFPEPKLTRAFLAISVLAVSLAFSAGSRAQSGLAEPPTLTAEALKALSRELSRGGYVIYFRHLDTVHDQEDQQPVDLNDCQKQRNLSAEGIARGKVIAAAFRKLRIPVGEVISSPFCRTVDTAKLLAGKATVDLDLFFAMSLTNEGKEKKGAALRRLLARTAGEGKNTLVIGHTANLQEAVGLWPKPEGAAYVFRPDGRGSVSAVARIEPGTWGAAAR